MRKGEKETKVAWSDQFHEILGGKASIFRVKNSGDVWQFRMWIADEKKHLRKSLKTRDLESAVKLAETKVFEIFSDVSTGKKLFGITLQELVDEYLSWRKKDVSGGIITKGRWDTIESQTKHILKYKSPNSKVSELDRISFFDWEQHRKFTTPGTQSVTIRNEQSTINQMIEFGYRKGFCHFPKFDFRKIKMSKDDVGRRSIFTLQEYDKLVYFMRTYTSKKSCETESIRQERMRTYASKKSSETESIRQERLMIRDCVLIASNTMCRVGELWQMKWGDIIGTEDVFDDDEKPISLVKFQVRAETSKVRSSRIVISRGGNYIDRLRKNTKHHEPDDFLFTEVDGTKRLPKRKWYAHWKNLMMGIGIENYQERKLTWYSLRHFGITCRIRAKVPYGDIAEIAGTSSFYIENHYSHYDDEMKIDAAVKNFNIDKNGILFR
jgi:integrase